MYIGTTRKRRDLRSRLPLRRPSPSRQYSNPVSIADEGKLFTGAAKLAKVEKTSETEDFPSQGQCTNVLVDRKRPGTSGLSPSIGLPYRLFCFHWLWGEMVEEMRQKSECAHLACSGIIGQRVSISGEAGGRERIISGLASAWR